MDNPHFDTLIMDLGGVLVNFFLQTSTAVKSLKLVLRSPTWATYECGHISESDCYAAVANELGSSANASQVGEAVLEARRSLQINEDLIRVTRELKVENGLRVFVMFNIPKPDFAAVKAKSSSWEVFDGMYPSYAVGIHKPDLAFYQHVLEETNTDPLKAIFVDDKLENVMVARSFGLTGITYDDTVNAARALRNLLGDPILRGEQFLSSHARRFESVTDNGTSFRDNFAQRLILDATGNRDLVALEKPQRTWNYFIGKPVLTTKTFPDDPDTTSIGLMTLNVDLEVVTSVMDEMLKNINSDGLVQVYFDKNRPRVDPVASVNISRLFYRYGRELQLQQTLKWITNVLIHRAYIDGTLYYYHAESFLYFLSRLFSENASIQSRFREPLEERLRERIGTTCDALSLAMRALACQMVGIDSAIDARALLPLQCNDGDWENGWMCKFGLSGTLVGNRGVTTALAIMLLKGQESRGEAGDGQVKSVLIFFARNEPANMDDDYYTIYSITLRNTTLKSITVMTVARPSMI